MKKDTLDKKIIKLKHKLYNGLLSYSISELTKEEVDIMYSLSKDRDIQETLEKTRL